ncbi:MAG: exopolysaccharide biosynthesis protein [Comamonadaceae bacterium]|nr:exopolysaccharide biosynthesis protein [Comamonadaceae bacterium]
MASTDTHPYPAVPGPRGALALRRDRAPSPQLLTRGETVALDDERIDLKTIWRALVKHKWTILVITILCTLAAVVYTMRTTPQYYSSALLQIDRTAQKVVGFNTEVEVDEAPLTEQLRFSTQIALIKSRSLAERVIDELGLYQSNPSAHAAAHASAASPDPAGTHAAIDWTGIALVDKALSKALHWWGTARARLTSPEAETPAVSRTDALARFERGLRVEPVRSSRLVKIGVLNPDPEQAARIANATAKAFIASNIERKVGSSLYARQYLEEQIRQTKAKLEESERVINDYAKKNEILNLGERGSAATQTFVDFSAALSKAEQDRIKAETLYNQVRLDPESAPQAVTNEAIRAYKVQRAQLQAEYARDLAVYKPDYPTMVQARAQIAELEGHIQREVNNILNSVQAQYISARRAEEQLKTRVASTRAEVLTVQDRSVDMNLLSRELDSNRQVYDSLLQRLKEVSVTAGITTNNVSIVDEARVPLFPAKPNTKVNIGLGVMLGLFLGMLAALIREQMDDSVKNANEIESRYRLPLLGLIPFTRQVGVRNNAVAMLAHRDPRSIFAEAYRSIRTALQFSTVGGAPQRFMVTSCGKGEGKTTTALALAINFAQLGQKVLLIDADMRKGGLHQVLQVSNERGLSTLLRSDRSSEAVIQETSIPNLAVITAGPVPPDPVELLMGPKLSILLEKAQDMGFTQIVIDGPPLLGIADAIVLGNQIENLVFAVKAGDTRKDHIHDALRRLRNAGLVPMGIVLTHARKEHAGASTYTDYYGYGYADGYTPRPIRPSPVPAHAVPMANGPRIDPTLG